MVDTTTKQTASDTAVAAGELVTVPEGKYLSDVLTLDQLPSRFLLDAPTGLGKSTLATKANNVIIAVSTQLAAMQIYKHVPGFGVWCGLRHDMTEGLRGVAVVYDSVPNLLNSCEWIEPKEWALIIDEQHNAALASYRKKALSALLEIVETRPWKQVGFMSGTPMAMPHGREYDRVTVRPANGLRLQAAQFVRYAEGKKDAVTAELVLQHVNKGKPVVIYLDSKTGKRDGILAELVSRGIDAEHIHTLDSDNKTEATGQHIIDNETLPEGCKVLITTAVLVESANINTAVGAAIILSPIHPNQAQQFVNRVRGAAVGVCYILNNGEGGGFGIDADKELVTTWKAAQMLCGGLNAITAQRERLGLDDRAKTLGGRIAKTVKFDNDKWEPCHLGVLQAVAELEREYCWNNPKAFQRALTAHNWQFAEPLDMTKDVTTAKGAKELKQQLKEVSQAKWLNTLAIVAKLGAVRAKGMEAPTPQQRRAVEVAAYICDTAGVTWDTAVGLLATGKDSGWAFGKAKRLASLHRLAEAGDTAVLHLIDKIKAAKGETLTQAERHDLVLDVMRQDETMKIFTQLRKRKSWEAAKPGITEKDANELIKGLCNVRPEVFRDESGNQYRAWIIGGLVSLPELAAKGAARINQAAGEVVCDTAVDVTPLSKSNVTGVCDTTFTKNNTKSGVTNIKAETIDNQANKAAHTPPNHHGLAVQHSQGASVSGLPLQLSPNVTHNGAHTLDDGLAFLASWLGGAYA
ncbi:MAG: hypothetical protein KDD89_03400 [Anaerolineales bacterium]|nr:hypothetical protein [Anaerolineales bacterium]